MNRKVVGADAADAVDTGVDAAGADAAVVVDVVAVMPTDRCCRPSWESYCAVSYRRDWPPMTVDFAAKAYCCTSAGIPGAVSSATSGVTWAEWRAC